MVGNLIEHIANDHFSISKCEVSLCDDFKVSDEGLELLTITTKAFKYKWDKIGLNFVTLFIVLCALCTLSFGCRCKLVSCCFRHHS